MKSRILPSWPGTLVSTTILILTAFLPMNISQIAKVHHLPFVLESGTLSKSHRTIKTTANHLARTTLYLGAGTLFESLSLLSRLGWSASLISPWAYTFSNELFLLGQLSEVAAEHAFRQAWNGWSAPYAQSSWLRNEMLLSQFIPLSKEDEELLRFLKIHWLAKSTGFFPSMVNWVYPSFGIHVQIHPETNSSYARDPTQNLLSRYKKRVEAWKEELPHPHDFPLLLTRPADISAYLPPHITASESINDTVERLALKMHEEKKEVLVDLTDLFHQKEWSMEWNAYQKQFIEQCKKQRLDLKRVLCIQRLQQKEIGGIRLLPLSIHSAKEIAHHDYYLLDWLALLGITANRIELDRGLPSIDAPQIVEKISPIKPKTQQELLTFLDNYHWASEHPQKKFMVEGTLNVLKGLLAEKQDALSPMRSSIVQISFARIAEQLSLLEQEKEASFFSIASRLEEVHADIAALLEILSPFSAEDFPKIFKEALSTIPATLRPLTSCGLHSSGMTSAAGIYRAVETYLGRKPRVLYGENTYYEAVFLADELSIARSIEKATEEDWNEADLLWVQFNPVLKRVDGEPTIYKAENILESVHNALASTREKPLTLVVDSTLDFINSPRERQLLNEFHQEIKAGLINFISFRSGLKFDLFGMDNYCGAPFYMIHNHEEKWAPFNALFTDPVLQSDHLSLNWFCLAYQTAVPELDLYRKQTFDNTRALLDKIPKRLFNSQGVHYRVVPILNDADPAFIDIRVTGPLHQLKAAALVGAALYIDSTKEGHPLFYRPSLGFYHPNYTMLFSKEISTIRLTVGIDPAQIDVLAHTFEKIDALNGSPWKTLQR